MGRKQRMRQSPKHKQPPGPAPLPPIPELVDVANELGAPELAQPLTVRIKEQPIRVFADPVEQRINTPERGDIIQIVTKPSQFIARIGIVHELKSDGTLVCYSPGKNGYPHQFSVKAESVEVVGKAKLKYNQPNLPEPSVYSDEAARLDQI